MNFQSVRIPSLFALGAVLAALATGGSAAPATAPADAYANPEAKRYVAEAYKAAGSDLAPDAERFCKPPPPQAAPPPFSAPGERKFTVYKPTRVFDNLYYVGSTFVGATVVKTSAGLVLIDTLTTNEEAEDQLVGGMKKLGLDPADIAYVIVLHAHGDHFGGVNYLRAFYPKFRVVMSEDDWAVMAKPSGLPDATSPKEPRGPRDIGFSGLFKVTLGDTTFQLIETPGHTAGTTSLIYPIRNGGKVYNVLQWGGGAPSDPSVKLADVERFVAAGRAAHVAVRWGSHQGPNWLKLQEGVGPNSPVSNGLIAGEEVMARYLEVMLDCKRAAAIEAAARGS